ncbi:MAG: hypothetical protein R6V12_01320, partial [Candidatus Hydrogenedentota bacterium]
MMKKVMGTLSVVALLVGFVGCPVTEQLLKTRLQGEWEYVDPEDPESKITLEFERDEVTMGAEFQGSQISITGTFEVVDNDTIEVTMSNLTQRWDIEFAGVQRKFTLTRQSTGEPQEFTRVSFR